LDLLLRIFRKSIGESKRQLSGQGRLAAIESCLNGLTEDVTVEVGMPRLLAPTAE